MFKKKEEKKSCAYNLVFSASLTRKAMSDRFNRTEKAGGPVRLRVI